MRRERVRPSNHIRSKGGRRPCCTTYYKGGANALLGNARRRESRVERMLLSNHGKELGMICQESRLS